MATQKPYNRKAKAKVTLAFAKLLYKPKNGFLGADGRAGKTVQSVENKVDRNGQRVKAGTTNPMKNNFGFSRSVSSE
jgi:hypothetical protein